MSGYDQYGNPTYNQGYPPQQGYQGGYPPQPTYGQGYDQNQQSAPQHYQQYPQDNYGQQHVDHYGPPQQGGFQHGQADHQFGTYNSSNPQGHQSYYGGQSPNPPHDAYAQNQAYQTQMGGAPGSQPQYDFNNKQQFPPQSSDPKAPNYDPKAPAMTDSERGLLGAIGGGLGGGLLGKKTNHGFLGTVGGAILGSLAEDMTKKKKHGSHSGSSWGGKY